MIGLPPFRVRWVLAVAAPLLGLVWLSGCENTIEYSRYPKDLEYPVRTDLIVPLAAEKPADEQPFAPPPGDINAEIALFKQRGGTTLDPNAVPGDQRKQLQASLQRVFGTPRQPQVGAAKGESPDLTAQLTKLKVRDAEGDYAFRTLSHGSKVYRYHCVHCHGLTGDGRGPTGPWVVPHPRDYRSGLFKFVSSADVGKSKPRRADLVRVLHNGIENTSMPSFALLDVQEPESKDKETDLEAAVSYVIHLSIRGEVEMKVFGAISEGEDFQMDEKVHELMTEVVGEWANADDKVIEPLGGDAKFTFELKDPKGNGVVSVAVPAGSYFDFKVDDYGTDPKLRDEAAQLREEASVESIRHGFQIFTTGGDAGCIKCHVDYGRQATFRYDKWGTMVRPMNLTTGVYRGGRRPIDLYWRIKAGIAPSGMPDAKSLTDDKDVWDLVRFVHALPYPEMLPEDVRNKVYDRPPDDSGKAERAAK